VTGQPEAATTTTPRRPRKVATWPIVVDTREQTPLPLAETIARLELPFTVERRTLQCGDYALAGFEHVVAVERKSIADLVACCAGERERFERALARMAMQVRHRVLLVEGSVHEVLLHQFRGTMQPWAVVASTLAWQLDYGVSTVWAGSRETAAEACLRLFGAIRRRIERSADADQAVAP
jgi:ERCC4-type nuclease